MPPISLLIKPASGNCNMSCDYCFYCDETSKREKASYGYMSEQTLKNVIRKSILISEGSYTLAFQGGEPTLIGIEFFKKVIEFVNQYNRNNLKVNYALQTNGFNIDEEWCEFFKANNFLIGLSVDGIKETHDLYRHDKKGGSTFDRILKTADLFDKFGVDYNILTVINSDTSKIAKPIYEYYKTKNWGFQQYITCFDPIGETPGTKRYSLKPEEYGTFSTELFDSWYKDLSNNKQPYIRQFENYIMIGMGYWPESCEQRGTCGLQYVVEADGSVYPCDFFALDKYYLGNLNTNTLKEIDEKRNLIKFIDESEKKSEECNSCEYTKICRGGCQRSRTYNSEKDSYQNYFCKGYKLFFDNCYDRIVDIVEKIQKRM